MTGTDFISPSKEEVIRRKDFIRLSTIFLGSLAWPGGARSAGLREFQEAAASADEDALWKIIRRQFALDPEWTYLNFGGLGACPLPVLHSFSEWSRSEELSPNAGHDEKEWWSVKERLASLLGKSCRKEDLALISSATEGINLIINGLPLKKGEEVITSTHEHVAVNTGLLNRMQRDGIVIRLFEPDLKNGLGNVERIARLINGRTRLILVSHLHYGAAPAGPGNFPAGPRQGGLVCPGRRPGSGLRPAGHRRNRG